MAENFDPYKEWLGIASEEHPIDHYRMLGVPRFELDLQKIANAADERMKMVRNFQTGRRGQYTQQILNELSSAKICLLNAGSKSTYDAVLEGQLAASRNNGSITMPQSMMSMLPPTAEMPQLSGWSESPPVAPPPFASPPIAPAFSMESEFPINQPPISTVSPPPFVFAPPSVPRSTTSPKPAPPPNESHESNEERGSLMARPWFPVALLGVIGGLVGCVVLIRSWRQHPAPPALTATEVAATNVSAPVQEPPTEPTTKAPPRRTSEAMLSQEGDGGVNFPPQLAMIHGQKTDLQTRDEEYVIGNWTSSEDSLTWRFHLVKPQHFLAQITYAAAEDAAGGRFAIVVDGDERQGEVRPGESPGKFHTDELYITVKKAGDHHLTLRAVNKPGAEFLTFKSLRFTPTKAAREKPKAE